jgi:nucleoside-diphosphate-sugar epimerase
MKIAMFGATGMLGLPVAQRLIQDGNELTALVRRGKEKEVPKGCRVIIGDLKNEDDIRKTVSSCEGIYLNLSVTQSSREKDFQPEREGIQDILKICEQENIKVIGYLSSLVQNYQGLNGFDWWVFRVKNQAVNMIQKHSIPSIIFVLPHLWKILTRLLSPGSKYCPSRKFSASYVLHCRRRLCKNGNQGLQTI